MKRAIFTQLFIRSCLESSPAHADLGYGRHWGGGSGISLHQLKQKLLLPMLEAATDPGLVKRLCAAANQAAELAWATDQPLLVFPTLFEELAAAARARPFGGYAPALTLSRQTPVALRAAAA